MAIASDQLDFKVVFKQKRGEFIQEIAVGHFFENELDFYEKREEFFIELKENIDLSLTFQSEDSDCRLYLDGLEALPGRYLEMDSKQGEVYLLPSVLEYQLFSNLLDYFPLIPGYYRMVVQQGERRFYSWIKILPKQMKETQWEIMKEELERELSGLAQDIILNKNGLKPSIIHLSPSLLGQFVVIKNRFPSVMAALSDLYQKINYRISKEYVLLPTEKIRIIDEKTIKHRLRHPENENTFKSPASKIHYDLPENQMIKNIVQSASAALTEFIEAVAALKRNTRKDNLAFRTPAEKERTILELDQLSEMSIKMRGAFQWIKTAPWYKEVGHYQSSIVPHVMNMDPRYRTLFQLNRELVNEKIVFEMDKTYSYQWKRTDKLYEIWGMIQFIKILSSTELGFVPTDGWIFSGNFYDQKLLLPTLPANTRIEFVKGDLKLYLIYEALLPTQSRLTTESAPLYTRGTHTCPDGRIDIYKGKEYMGSIIFDFKYRPKKSIWDQERIYNNQPTGTMQQLVSYGDNLHSPFLFNQMQNTFFSHNMNPVHEVWAIYPNQYGPQKTYEYPDHNLRLIEMTPGSNNEHLAEELKRILGSVPRCGNTLL